ncbi:DUF7504 family protein [Halorarum halobium]|uniref:DUF7504 family protein n=1 Tax=Halorarum halobium TaxID=3075121 RepID=UPI0028B1FF41|nr:hypothetical protein [Halobaculum sp. XH14]
MLEAVENPLMPGPPTSDRTISVDAGQQVLLAKRALGPPLSELPDAAFENALVVTTGSTPRRIQRRVEERGLDPRKIGVVPVSSNEVEYEGPLWTGKRVAPSDLTGISVEVSRGFQYLDPGQGWLVFDSLSTLLLYSEERRVYKLVDWLMGNARGNDVRGVYSLYRDVVAPPAFGRFRSLCDDLLEIDAGE